MPVPNSGLHHETHTAETRPAYDHPVNIRNSEYRKLYKRYRETINIWSECVDNGDIGAMWQVRRSRSSSHEAEWILKIRDKDEMRVRAGGRRTKPDCRVAASAVSSHHYVIAPQRARSTQFTTLFFTWLSTWSAPRIWLDALLGPTVKSVLSLTQFSRTKMIFLCFTYYHDRVNSAERWSLFP